MRSVLIARGVAVLGLPALVLSVAAAPAFAGYKHDDKKYDKVAVEVCKTVKDSGRDDNHKYRDDKKKPKFTIHVWTDKDYEKVVLKDGECDDIKLKYGDNKVSISEDKTYGYKLKDIKVDGDVRRDWWDGDTKVVKFKNKKDYPSVSFEVINKQNKKYDHH
jgi:hypothetical protein